MRRSPLIIEEANLSVAWSRAFLGLMDGVGSERALLGVIVTNVGQDGTQETMAIRTALDESLVRHGKRHVRRVASSIFPTRLWRPGMDRTDLYRRYGEYLARGRRLSQAVERTYFARLVSFGHNESRTVNQLEHIITTYRRGNHRRSALQASVFDPMQDHTNQRQRGFPCLQHVFFAPTADGHLDVTGTYAVQYLFERAYGNYLGLCHLGRFMAHEMGLTLRDVRCFAMVAQLGGIAKRSLLPLAELVRSELSGNG